MPKSATVKLGDRQYVIAEKYAGISEKWRAHIRESSVFKTLQSLDGITSIVFKAIEASKDGFEIGHVATIANFVPSLLMSLSTSMDDINDLIFDYVPEMAADREWIMDNVYDSDLVEVFLEILKINFPIMRAWEMVRGSLALGTSTNLPTQNGATGTKRPAARSKAR